MTAFGVYKYAAGHFPVGWRHHSIPFNKTTLGWQRGGIPTVAKLIQEWFGEVDHIVVNVGIWARSASSARVSMSNNPQNHSQSASISEDDNNPQRHYLYGPVEKVISELQLLHPLSRQVQTITLCDFIAAVSFCIIILTALH